jgi:hypothetical protein
LALHYWALHYWALHYWALHYLALHYWALHYWALHYWALRDLAVRYWALHYWALRYWAVRLLTRRCARRKTCSVPDYCPLRGRKEPSLQMSQAASLASRPPMAGVRAGSVSGLMPATGGGRTVVPGDISVLL